MRNSINKSIDSCNIHKNKSHTWCMRMCILCRVTQHLFFLTFSSPSCFLFLIFFSFFFSFFFAVITMIACLKLFLFYLISPYPVIQACPPPLNRTLTSSPSPPFNRVNSFSPCFPCCPPLIPHGIHSHTLYSIVHAVCSTLIHTSTHQSVRGVYCYSWA